VVKRPKFWRNFRPASPLRRCRLELQQCFRNYKQTYDLQLGWLPYIFPTFGKVRSMRRKQKTDRYGTINTNSRISNVTGGFWVRAIERYLQPFLMDFDLSLMIHKRRRQFVTVAACYQTVNVEEPPDVFTALLDSRRSPSNIIVVSARSMRK